MKKSAHVTAASDGWRENRWDDCSTELDQQLWMQVELPKLAQEVKPFLGLFDLMMEIMFKAPFMSRKIPNPINLNVSQQTALE